MLRYNKFCYVLPLGYKRITSLFLLYKTPSSLENSLLLSSTIIFSKLSHPLKQGNASLELLSIFFIFSDSVIFFNVLQSVNVSSPMDTTSFPSIMLVQPHLLLCLCTLLCIHFRHLQHTPNLMMLRFHSL